MHTASILKVTGDSTLNEPSRPKLFDVKGVHGSGLLEDIFAIHSRLANVLEVQPLKIHWAFNQCKAILARHKVLYSLYLDSQSMHVMLLKQM
jgi:hypothetical protein